MSNVLISICVPAYYAKNLIGETLESIKNQVYTNWELIVIEDGSDDGTVEIINIFRKTVFQEVLYYKNIVNKGLPATRNVAVSKAKGAWLAFVDSDDVWHPDHLQSLVETAYGNPDYDFIHSGYNHFVVDINKPTFKQSISIEKLTNFPISFYKREYNIQPSSVMVSKKLFEAVNGFDETYLSVEDLNFYFRSSEKGFKFKYTGKSTLYYRNNPNGMTKESLKMTLYAAKAYEDTMGWKEIPKKLKHNKTAEYWLATARLSRKTDLVLAKSAIKSAIKHRVTIFGLMIFVRIYLTPVKYNKP
jgi:glycosyltransferase involved in cell wall biosynthesis